MEVISQRKCSAGSIKKLLCLLLNVSTLAKFLEFEDTGRNCFRRTASSPSVAIGSDVSRRKEESHNVGKNLANPSAKQPTQSVSSERRESNSLMNLDEGDMQDHEWQGLAIPMDNLSDVHFEYWF